jgi:hypothetical protein
MDEQVYQRGDTIRLTCTFYNFDNVAVDPSEVKMIIYDSTYTKTSETILNSSNRTGTGIYFYDYFADVTKDTKIIYEWHGIIEGTPSIKRGSFNIVFI